MTHTVKNHFAKRAFGTLAFCGLLTFNTWAQSSVLGKETVGENEGKDVGLEIVAHSQIKQLQERIDSIDAHISRVERNTVQTYLTTHDWDDCLSLLLTLIAALGTGLTAYIIDRENRRRTIKKNCQKALLRDLIRHLYRNKIIVNSLIIHLMKNGLDKYYPSQEHILKLKFLPEDLHFEDFDDKNHFYHLFHELELKFRNYNIEVEVACEHLCDKGISRDIKRRDLDTLDFKAGYLTEEIVKVMIKTGIFSFEDKQMLKAAEIKKDEKILIKAADILDKLKEEKKTLKAIENLLKEIKENIKTWSEGYSPQKQSFKDFGYENPYLAREEYIIKYCKDKDQGMKGGRFFYDTIGLKETLEWDLQFELDKERNPNKIMIISF